MNPYSFKPYLIDSLMLALMIVVGIAVLVIA